MSTVKTTVVVGAAAFGAMSAAFYYFADARSARGELVALQIRETDAKGKIDGLERDLRAAEQQVASVDRESAALLKSARGAAATAVVTEVAGNVPITSDLVQVHYQQAKALAQSGQWDAALREFLWCFDVGMPQVSSFSGVRSSYVPTAIKNLGEHVPEALTALRDRRDRAGQELMTGQEVSHAIADFAVLNRTLGEPERTLQAFDQLPEGDRRRVTMAIYANDLLIEAKRYTDVMAGSSYAIMSSSFEVMLNRPESPRDNKEYDDYVVTTGAKSVEVLAGVGDLAHARVMIGRVLSYDHSEATKLALKARLERAGHPELLDELGKP